MSSFTLRHRRGLTAFRSPLPPFAKSNRFFERLDALRYGGAPDSSQNDPLPASRFASDDDSEESVFDRFAKELAGIGPDPSTASVSPNKYASAQSVAKVRTEPSLVVFDMTALRARFEKLETSEKSLRAILKKFDLSGDDGRRTLPSLPKDFAVKMTDLKLRFPNCVEFLDFVDHFAHLARLRPEQPHLQFPPVLLSGPPGIGKTAVVREAAKLLAVKCRVLDMASTTAGFVLSGMSSSWSEAKTGCIVDLLRNGRTANPILVLDEIDKTTQDSRYDPLGALYTLLEPDAARQFVDEALDIPCDASQVLIIATANDPACLSAPLLSRFVTLPIEPIGSMHRAAIIRSIYRAALEQLRVAAHFESDLGDDVVEQLIDFSPRQTKIALMRSIAVAAGRICEPETRAAVRPEDLVKPNDVLLNKPVGFIW